MAAQMEKNEIPVQEASHLLRLWAPTPAHPAPVRALTRQEAAEASTAGRAQRRGTIAATSRPPAAIQSRNGQTLGVQLSVKEVRTKAVK